MRDDRERCFLGKTDEKMEKSDRKEDQAKQEEERVIRSKTGRERQLVLMVGCQKKQVVQVDLFY